MPDFSRSAIQTSRADDLELFRADVVERCIGSHVGSQQRYVWEKVPCHKHMRVHAYKYHTLKPRDCLRPRARSNWSMGSESSIA